MPTGVLVLYGLLMLVFLGGARFLVHVVYERPLRGFRARRDARSVLIVGAGDGGRLLLREILRNPELGYRPGRLRRRRPAQAGRAHRPRPRGARHHRRARRVLDDVEPDEVLIAIPSAPGTLRAKVVSACRERGVPVRTMPTVFELLQTGGAPACARCARSSVEDVLGREPVRMEIERVGGYLTGRVVLVTGAGGSIGAELCRQIARVGPARLVLLDHAEDNLFEIERELDRGPPRRCNTVAVLADCKDEERMREVFAEHRPTVVFHAAAYKHVGADGGQPGRGGAQQRARHARDDAAWPATRGVERVRARLHRQGRRARDGHGRVQGAGRVGGRGGRRAAIPARAFARVRFGNVLGSSGSVVPIFRRQIAAGGPVTVTDPRMTRYFMTIPEAVQLVIRAGLAGRAAARCSCSRWASR